MPKVNPEILKWARETAGLTLEEASKKLRISKVKDALPSERLSSLEIGDFEPSRPMLLKMSNVYRRPLIVFYMESPPNKSDRGQDFRTLPDSYTNLTEGLIDALIRNVQARQSILKTALEDDESTKEITIVGSKKLSDGVVDLINSISEYTGIDIQEFRNQATPAEAFKYIRNRVEAVGIFVLLIGDLGSHHTSFDLEVFRGFALSDEIAPFIVINDKDSRAAWSFTLIHELTHIFLGQTGISSLNSNLEIEKFCNGVASNFLLPEKAFNSLEINNSQSFDFIKNSISEFAKSQNLSSSMVAYRLFLDEKIDKSTWILLNKEYRQLWIDSRNRKKEKLRKKSGGPSYFVIRRHRLGENLIANVHQMIIGGSLTTINASKILGVSPKKVYNLVEPNLRFEPN